MQDVSRQGAPDRGVWTCRSEETHRCDGGWKYEHFAENRETGERINLDFNPYEKSITPMVFDMLVGMGFPPRPTLGPWRPFSVVRAYEARMNVRAAE